MAPRSPAAPGTTAARKVAPSDAGSSAQSKGTAPPTEIRGRVVGDEGGPVKQAVVWFLPDATEPTSRASPFKPPAPVTEKAARVETREDGSFVAQGLTGQAFTLRAAARGYAAFTQPQVPAGATVRVSLKRGFTLSGIVRDLDNQKPIAEATVIACDQGATRFGEGVCPHATTGKDGRFTLADLPRGAVNVEARAPGRAPGKKENVSVPQARPRDNAASPGLELFLDPGSREGRGISGRVTDTVGAPVAGAEVAAAWYEGPRMETRRARTTAEGRYRITGLGERPVQLVVARARGFATAERVGAPPVDGVVDLVLERMGSIIGRVQMAGGGILPAFQIRVHRQAPRTEEGAFSWDRDQDQNGSRVSMDPAGAFRVDDLDPGTYTIEVVAERHAPVKESGVPVAAEQVADAGTVTLESDAVLRGRVLDARDGSPVLGASIRVEVSRSQALGGDPSTPAADATSSGDDGSFTIVGLHAGSFLVTVQHPYFSPAHVRVEMQPDVEAPELVVRMSRGGILTGMVLDGQKQPAPGVRIVVDDATGGDLRTAVTGPDGRYTFDGLAAGTYQVMRPPEGAVVAMGLGAKTAVIRDDETTIVDFDGSPRILLRGRVLRGDAPLGHTSLFLIALDGSPGEVKRTESDAEGAFQIGLDHGGRYQASVRTGDPGGPGGQSTLNLIVPDLAEVQQDIVLTLSVLSGRVSGPDGSAIQGATVTALRDGAGAGDPPRQSVVQSGVDGAYRVEGIDPGTYRITARATGYRSAEFYPLNVSQENPTPTVDLTIEPGWTLRGRVVDPQGRGIPNALVVVAPPGSAESGSLPSSTDGGGAFRITAPGDGPVNVTAIAAGWAPAGLEDVMPPTDEQAPGVLLQASLGGTLRIRVVGHDGEPVAGVQVALQPEPLFPGSDVVADRNRPKPTDAGGTALVSLLSPRDYVVTVPGRRGVDAVRATVSEGTETAALITLP